MVTYKYYGIFIRFTQPCLRFYSRRRKKAEAARRFAVARSTLYRWLAAENPLTAEKTGPKKMRVIDEEALQKHVADFPDLTYQERAEHFGVSTSCIRYGLRKLGITRKKRTGYKQRCDVKRATYRQELTRKETEGKSAVYVDECGFRAESFRPYAYAPKGEVVSCLISSQKHRATSMIAAQIEGVFTAHSLFEGSCNGERFNQWLEQDLCPHLSAEHVVIMDNARYHKTEQTKELIEKTGAELFFFTAIFTGLQPD